MSFKSFFSVLTLLVSFTLYIVSADADTTGPYIMRDYPYDITTNSAMIAWTTNELSDSRVEYCTDRVHCGVFTPLESKLTTDHRIRINGMRPGTRYYYWVYSEDAAGNVGSSGYRVFNTSFVLEPSVPVRLSGYLSAVISTSPTPTPAPTPTPVPVYFPLLTPVATPVPMPTATPLMFIYLPTFTPIPAAVSKTVNSERFNGLGTNMTVEEAGSMTESLSSDWWVNSGAYLVVENGIGRTVMGALPAYNKWHQLYTESNPTDTDNGSHPQNIFRLITRSAWDDSIQEAYFKISKYWTSTSPNRDGYNGTLLLNRYVDGNNLYYAGIRVDGQAVIKKKLNGKYFNLAFGRVYPGIFDRDMNPNLIPEDSWFGIKSEVRDNINGSVSIKLYIDRNNNGNWELAAEAIDDGLTSGRAINEKAYAGIRTDFMDVYVRDYSIKGI